MSVSLLEKYRAVFAPEGLGDSGGGDSGGGGSSPSSGSPSSPSSSPSSSPASVPDAGGSPPSTPASVPAPSTPPSATPPASPGEAFDFSSIFEDRSDDGPTLAQATPPKPPEVPPEVPAVAPPAAPPKAAEAAPVAPSAPVPATPQTPPAAEFDRYDPAMLSQHLAGNEAQALDYVAQNMFKLTPEEVEALETNVIDAVPKLLAKVFVKSQQNVLMQLASIVPVMMQRQTVAMQRNSDNQEKFYARWPQVEKAKHGDLVTKYAAVYRQMHPTAGLDQMIEDLGPMVMMAGRINPGIPAPSAPGAVNPAAQRAAGNGRPPPPTPFVPAGNMAPAMASTTPEISPWEAMFRQDE